MARTFLASWLDPRYKEIEVNKKIVTLSGKVDSLALEVRRKDAYINSVRKMILGDTNATDGLAANNGKKEQIDIDYISPVDMELRKEMENKGTKKKAAVPDLKEKLPEMFFAPVEGKVYSAFNTARRNYGVNIQTLDGAEVKSIAEGMIFLNSYSLENGFLLGIQHNSDYISIYKGLSGSLKKEGNLVNAGDVIGKSGGKGVYIELWHKGNPVNPADYIAF